jgi:hypothetical protein
LNKLDNEAYAKLAEASVVPLDIWYNDNLVEHGKYIASQLSATGYTVVRKDVLEMLLDVYGASLRTSPVADKR